jgi:putative tryptophan/tyrosine transport system substrate-binding protein
VVKNKLSFVAVALVALGLSGQAVAQAKIEVGVTWAGKSGATTRLYTSMKDRLQEIAPQISLEFAGEQADIAKVEETIKKFDSSKAATVALRDSAATLLATLKTVNPTFLGGTNNPKFYGTIKNIQAPEGNITGVTYFLPKDIIIRSFISLLPEADFFSFIGDTKHSSFAVDKEGSEEACKQLKLRCTFHAVTTADEAKDIAARNPDGAKAFVLMNHGLLIDNTKAIVASAGKVPTFAFGDASVKDGAVAGLVADVGKLGVQLADAINDVLVKKKPVSAVPVGLDNQPLLVINMGSVNRLGLNIPLEILSTGTVVD